MSSLIVSSSGIRAVVGETMTPELATAVGASFGMLIGKGPIVLGGDTRVSYEMVSSAVISGLQSVGTDVICIGKVPTPTVQQLIKKHNAKGGVVITASHNPIMWNGIKLMNESGSFLTSEQYASFIELFENKNFERKPWDQIGQISYDTEPIDAHIDLILDKIDTSSIQKSKLKVLVDANNGTGAVADPSLLDKLGVEYTILNKEPSGRFAHDPEPLKKNLDQIIEELKKGDYDIGFVQDADADRLVILDENGRFIGEDYSLALCVDCILTYEKRLAEKKDIVVNLSTSKVIEYIAEKHNGDVHYTRIGEPNVTARLKELNAVVGGEGNGGVIYPEVGWGRDSLVGIVIALKYLAESNKTVSEIVSDYPQYLMMREKFCVSTRDEVNDFLGLVEKEFGEYPLNKEDGVKVSLPTGWVHVRPSNTEPIVRIFIEEQSSERAEKLMSDVLSINKGG